MFGSYQTIQVIAIIDQTNGSVIDSFMAYDPVMSSDQRWLVMRDFYPLHPQITPSEAYLLYDLDQSGSSNRHGLKPYTDHIPGWQIYPVVPKNAPADWADVPDSEYHRFRSRTFHWAPDNNSLVFADSVQETLSIVLVTLQGDKIQTYVHPVSRSEGCKEAGASDDTSHLTLTRAEISSIPVGGPVVQAEFEVGYGYEGPRCTKKQLTLQFDDFQRAKTEIYKPVQRKEAVPKLPR